MRKSLLALAPLALGAFAGAALADDSSVTLYGVLDAGIAQVQHSANFDPNFVVAVNPTNTKVNGCVNGAAAPCATSSAPSATGMFNGGNSATRWGIKGQEDMGGGLKAVFLLESAFNLPSGNTSNAAASLARNTSTKGPAVAADSAVSGQLFARGAYAGLSSASYGTLTIGRHQSFFLDSIAVFDPLKGSQLFSPIGFAGSYGGGGATDDSRVDNSLKYKIAVGDVTIGALYKFGGVAGSNGAQGAYQLNAVYAAGPLAVQAGYEQFKDASSVANGSANTITVTGCTPLAPATTCTIPATNTVALTFADTKAFMLSAKYTLPTKTTLNLGFEREEYTNPSNPTVDAATTSIFNQTVSGTVNVTAYPNQKNLNVYWVGAQQEYENGFSVLVGYYHVTQNAYGSGANAGCSSAATSATCSGTQSYISLLGDYRFTKRTDTYAGFMSSKVSGGPANGYVDTSNRVLGVGLRHVF